MREAIAGHYADQYGVDVAPERVIVTAGSSAALLLVMALLVNRDDRILLADPGYPCNRHFVRVLEGEPVGVPVGPAQRYQLSADLIERHWTPRTRGALIASPSNPTGTMVERDEMQRIVAAVERLRGALVVDEIYLGLSYEGARAVGARAVRRAVRHLELLEVFQHDRLAAGLDRRAGASCPRPREARAEPLHLAVDLSQHAALACFRADTLAIAEERREAFRARRDFLVPALRALGFAIPVMPGGGFFVYADCSRFCDDSLAFCRDVLEATGVAFTPGIDFGSHRADQHVRFAYTIGMEKLEQGVERLERYLRRPV